MCWLLSRREQANRSKPPSHFLGSKRPLYVDNPGLDRWFPDCLAGLQTSLR